MAAGFLLFILTCKKKWNILALIRMKNTDSRNIQISQSFLIYTIDSDRQIHTV